MILIDYGEAEKAMPLVGPVCRIDCDPAAIIYTSGSTGMPKGVVVSHRNLTAGAESVAAYLHNSPQDRILSILPFSFDYGLNQLTTSLLCGATLVLQNYLGPADIIKALESEQITGLAGIPTIWSQLLLLEWSTERFPALRYITNSGGRFPEFQVREYRRRLPRVQIYLMYGLTEAFRSTYLDPRQVDIRPTSIGKAIPNAEVMILNEQGMQCAPGEIGELVHRGVHVSLGYWNDREQTGIRFRPNPLQASEIQVRELAAFSGDLAKTDDEGYLYFIGRKDHMIKTSGFRVSPTEIEEYFYSTGVVRDAVAVGVPDDALGETISVVVSLREAGSIGDCELLSLVSREMPSFMVPKAIEIRHELPKNSNGKIDRTAIYQDVLGRFTSDAQHGI
jgi:acyl-CoA ligase (AMP-forming) (exosortase A-associated)